MKEPSTFYVGGNVIQTNKIMRPREPFDFYATDEACIRAYFAQHPLSGVVKETHIVDPGAGAGAWGKVLRDLYPMLRITGVELQERFAPHPAYDYWHYSDFRSYSGPKTNYVIGNPPYKYAEEFLVKAVSMLNKSFAEIIMLLRLGFLASESRFSSFWAAGMKPTLVTVLNTRPSFTGDNKTYPGDFAIFRWTFHDGECDQQGKLSFLTYQRPGLGKEG